MSIFTLSKSILSEKSRHFGQEDKDKEIEKEKEKKHVEERRMEWER